MPVKPLLLHQFLNLKLARSMSLARILSSNAAYIRQSWINLFFLVLIFCNAQVQAETKPSDRFQPLEDIKKVAEEFVTQMHGNELNNRHVSAHSLDPRLRLAACDIPLNAYLPDFSRPGNNMTIGVKCMGKNNWSLYVPVQIVYTGEVVVLNQPLARGTIISKRHVKKEKRNLSHQHQDYYTDIDAVIGQMARRPLQSGKIVNSLMLERPKLVKRGETVTMIASLDSIKVSMNGKALMDGHVGQRIRVKNDRSQRIVEGIVQPDRIIYLD